MATPEEIRAGQRLRQQLTGTQVAQELADLLEQYARMWPTMSAQTAVGLAQQGLAPDSPVVVQVAQEEGVEQVGATRDHRGFFAKAGATLMNAVGEATDQMGDIVGGAAKGITRAAFTVFDTAHNELIKRPLRAIAYASDQASKEGDWSFDTGTFFGSLGDGYDRGRNTSAGTMALRGVLEDPSSVGSLLTGGEDTLGSGWVPGGEYTQSAERHKGNISIGGGGADFGDLVATTFLEPNTSSHEMWSGMLQLGFDIGSDPAGAAIGAATKVRKAGKALGQSQNLGLGVHVANQVDATGALKRGLVYGERPTVVPEVVSAYTRSDEFAPIAARILDPEVSSYDLFQHFGGKLDPTQIAALRQAAGPDELAAIVDDLLMGDSILGAKKVSLRAGREPSRWASLLPQDHIDLGLGRRQAATELDRALIAAKVPREARAGLFEQWANVPELSTSIGRVEARRVVLDGYKLIGKELVANGADPEAAKHLTNVYGRVQEQTKYLVDALAEDPLTAHVKSKIALDGGVENVDLRLISEMVNTIPLPNIRQISMEMTGGALDSKLFKSAYQLELAASDTILKAWVPLQLLRGAWTVRVVGEEQIRMAVSGFDSMLSHPGSLIAWAMGKKGDGDALGRAFDDGDVFFEKAQTSTYDAWFATDGGKVATGHHAVTRPGEPGHWRNVAYGLRKLHDDSLARRVAAGESTDDIVSYLTSDKGASTLEAVAAQFSPQVSAAFRNSPDAIREYVDGFVRQGVYQQTGGVPELLELVATGKLEGFAFNAVRTDRKVMSKMTTKIRSLMPDAPELASGPVFEDAAQTSRLTELVNIGMTHLMGKPTNYLSRSPTFKQAYWERTRELMGAMTPDVRAEVLENAGKVFGDSSNEMVALRKAASASGAGGAIDDLKKYDKVAKAHALEVTRDLLYDQSARHQWVDMTRGIFVFAEAWREIGTTWLKLASQQPNVINRFEQGVGGMRDSGAFYTDPQTGEEMFAYPAGGWAAKAFGVVGAGLSAVTPGDFGSIPFEGAPEFGEVGVRQVAPVSSLNLFAGSVMPGVGPVVSMAAAQLLPDIPEADWLRDALFPFGEQGMDGDPGSVVEAGLPSWMKKMYQGWTEGKMDRNQYANARFDVMRALKMRDPDKYEGADGQERLLADSVGVTNNLFAIRATEQVLGAPAAPRVELFVRDMSGEAFNFAALVGAYWDLFDDAGGDHSEATRQFIERFGVAPDLIRQGKTRSVNKRAMTEPGAAWERRHPELAAKFPQVIGYFAPEDFDATFDGAAFDRAVANGDREQLDNATMLKLANKRTGSIAFDNVVGQLEAAGVTGPALTTAKTKLREALAKEYPGFGETIPIKGRLRPKESIPHLEEAIKDPVLAATPQGKALKVYLDARREFLDATKAQYGASATLGAKRVLVYRQALAAIGKKLVERYDGFSMLWDEVLSAEINAAELEENSL